MVFIVALVFRLLLAAVLPYDRSPASDQGLLVGLASSLAEGRGYQLQEGMFWPGQPTLIQSPGWPVLLSLPYRIVPAGWRWPVARTFAIVLDAGSAVLMALLAVRMGGGPGTALAAGGLYALNPLPADIAAGAGRDASAIFFMLSFLVCVCGRARPGVWLMATGGLLLGYACLIRTNWLLLGALFCIGFLWIRRRDGIRTLIAAAVFALMLAAVQAPWLIRNAVVFGRFPAFGAGGGETLYGGNNELSARVGGAYWGYFVFPDKIPGETPMRELAARMTEMEVDDYYRRKALVWLRANSSSIPGLILGKLVRAYIPLPRTRGVTVLAGSASRWLIYALSFGGTVMLWRSGRRLSGHAAVAVAAVFATQLATVAIFCGYYRYALSAEILLSIPAGWLVWRKFSAWRGHCPLRETE